MHEYTPGRYGLLLQIDVYKGDEKLGEQTYQVENLKKCIKIAREFIEMDAHCLEHDGFTIRLPGVDYYEHIELAKGFTLPLTETEKIIPGIGCRKIDKATFMTSENHIPHEYARTAEAWLKDNPLFLDTETTGLDNNAEVVEISIIDRLGNVLMDTLIKPKNSIPKEATAIHGITNDMVANAPAWPEIHDNFYQIIEGRRLIIYNREYDERIINQTVSLYDSLHTDHSFDSLLVTGCCAMHLFSAYYGQWDDYHDGWKWKKLTDAAEYMQVPVHGEAHRALADCRMTLGIVQAMADSLPPAEVSDGHHTFKELYEHRHWLWINLLHNNSDDAFKTWLDDKGNSMRGWFIAGMNTPQGQITYHLPERLWGNLDVTEVAYNSGYDGHSSQDVLKRLEMIAIEQTIPY